MSSAEPSPAPRGSWLVYTLLSVLLLALLGLGVIAVDYVAGLDRAVRSQFEGQRWALPARVYARPLELFQGLALTTEQLKNELLTLNYRRDATLGTPGVYVQAKNEVRFVTRAFRFWDTAEPSLAVRAVFAQGRLKALHNLKNDTPLDLLRLDPVLVGSIYPAQAEDRVLLQIKEVPPLLTRILIAAEDRRYYQHHGIDPTAIMRAIWSDLRARAAVQGGSTLTQQLAKNFYLSSERTLSRKLNEVVMALLLEVHYSKDEILEAYLNEVFLGQEGSRAIHGFGMASHFYFGRALNELQLPQFALLVGLVRGASYLDPRRHPERALAQRNRVLDVVLATGDISAAQATAAKRAPLGVTKKIPSGASPYPAFMDLVRRQLQSDYKDADLTSEGLQIFTTLDPLIQAGVERAVSERAAEMEKRFRIPAQRLEAAVLVTSSENGEVLAISGGRDARYPGFNRALDSLRPIGSLIKPAVFLTALAQPDKYTLATLLDDGPLSLRNKGGRTWQPKNYDHKDHGMVPLHSALAHSYNVSSARLGLAVGVPNVLQTLQQLGVKRTFKAYPSALLGALDMSPLEVTQYYQTLASGGFRLPLRAIREVLTSRGQPLQRYALSIEQAFNPAPVYLLTTALEEVVSRGTAQAVRKQLPAKLIVAGKTGTTDDLRDSWFAGFSGQHLAVVWLGRDDNKPTGLSGATGALKVWGDIMGGIGTQSLERPQPDDVEFLRVAPNCRGEAELPFIIGSGGSDLPDCGSESSYAENAGGAPEAAPRASASQPKRNLRSRERPRENSRRQTPPNPFKWLKDIFR